MKRLALAGTFALLGGAATLLMVASILYSCRQGGHPHDMGTQSWAPQSEPSPTVVVGPDDAAEATDGPVLRVKRA